MSNIKAADVAKLRKQTGAGMMDCKTALVEANGDFDAAIDILRKKGQKVAAKRADRQASEGVAVTKINSENTVGIAILNTSITIVFGFSILVLSNFIPTIYFGVFTGIAMLLAMISVLTLLPKLILIYKPFDFQSQKII